MMRLNWQIWLFFLAVSTVVSIVAEPSANDDEEDPIESITVMGLRIDQTTAETGSTVHIIDADEISAMGFPLALDVLATVPGVTLNQNGTFGGIATVRIRGAASAQTLVLIDGVTVNDTSSPGGGFDFARLDTNIIERIEILSGPQSTLWGADAIGGVVSVTTRQPVQARTGSLFAETGSFDTLRGGATVSKTNSTSDFRLSATKLGTDGISRADERNGNTEEDGFDSLTLSARGGLQVTENARIEGSLHWNDTETEFDSFRFGAEGSIGDGDEVSHTAELSGYLAMKGHLFDPRFQNLLLIGHAEIDRKNFSNGAQSFDAIGKRTGIRYQGNLAVDQDSSLAFGVERESQTASGNESTIAGLFGLYKWQPMSGLTLMGGVRVDDHERFGTETTGRIGVAFRTSSELTLRTSWGQGFKPPTIFQSTFFCCGANAANDALRPEHAAGFDIGAEWRPNGRLERIGVTYFLQRSEDLIDFSFVSGGYLNIAEAESNGVEVSIGCNLTDVLSASIQYAYVDAETTDGRIPVRLPRHSGDLTMKFDPAGPLSANLLLRMNGRETNADGSMLGDWTRIDLNVRYELTEKFEIYSRIENLLDSHYQQILGYGTPGLSGSVGVRWRY